MTDSGICWEVIIFANRCVYREYVLNEKCFFFLELKEAKVACSLTCFALHYFCGHLKLSCQGKSPSKGRYKFISKHKQ